MMDSLYVELSQRTTRCQLLRRHASIQKYFEALATSVGYLTTTLVWTLRMPRYEPKLVPESIYTSKRNGLAWPSAAAKVLAGGRARNDVAVKEEASPGRRVGSFSTAADRIRKRPS
ncbi:hypothetical protein CI15_24410 [Paraburkholderia monticola]|uniref:Uncharacterized protein n=1 Tax=Paraburkholderia monticola TaxID=1399968 RepID=A0A149PF56_9BURK|nr:hypothetical protein CI15_24410 [Paraburkholderia monticola]